MSQFCIMCMPSPIAGHEAITRQDNTQLEGSFFDKK
jgi:hypothetical protein